MSSLALRSCSGPLGRVFWIGCIGWLVSCARILKFAWLLSTLISRKHAARGPRISVEAVSLRRTAHVPPDI